MTFDPATAYEADYKFQDFIEDVTWERNTDAGPVRVASLKGQWGDFNTPESQSVAAGIQFTNEAAAVVVWQPDSADGTEPIEPFAPIEGQILRRDNGEGWQIKNGSQSRLGHWVCACQREVFNG